MLTTLRVARGAAAAVARSSSSAHPSFTRTTPSWARFFAAVPQHQIVPLPALSPTMEQGNIGKWHVKEGDEIKAGDVIAEVVTDKATVDWEFPKNGFVAKLLVRPGQAVNVSKPVLVLVDDKDKVAEFKDFSLDGAAPAPAAAAAAAPAKPVASAPPAAGAQAPTAPAAVPAAKPTAAPAAPAPAAPAADGGRVIASPVARKIAEEHNVPLAGIVGSGPRGRILKSDVQDAIAAGPKPAAAAAAAPAPAAPVAAAAAPLPPPPPVQAGASYTDIPNNNIRRVIAKRLLESKVQIPHYYLNAECRVDDLAALRDDLNKRADKSNDYKLSFNDFVIKAAALALRRVPAVNSSWSEEFVRQYNTVDISVAVQTDNGLITPIVANADQKGLVAISRAVKDLAAKARAGRLQLHEFQGGSFTISNLGMYGMRSFNAIINPPQSSILAVGSVESRPIVVKNKAGEESLAIGKLMDVTLSSDHRVVDGALGAQWLAAFKAYIENPTTMLL